LRTAAEYLNFFATLKKPTPVQSLNSTLSRRCSWADRKQGQAKAAKPAIRLAFETRMKAMKKFFSMICAATAIALTAGCATHGNAVALNAGVGRAPYDGFYDDYYGPFDDGYWGDDGAFYYSDGVGGFHRDDGGHFRHGGGSGFHGIHTGGFGGIHTGGFHGGTHMGGGAGRAGGGGGRR
jgi:hypothetical protein